MEYQKDNNEKDVQTALQNSVPNAVERSLQNIALFRDKSLKVASALHLVTELFSESEPIRQALREQAIALVMLAADRRITESSEAVDGAHFVLDTTMSLITVLNTSKLLSDMNARILVDELSSVRTVLENIAIPSVKLSELVLHELFSTAAIAPTSTIVTPEVSEEKKNEYESITHVSETAPETLATQSHYQRPTSTSLLKTSMTSATRTSVVPTKPAVVGTKDDRRGAILAAIQKEGSSIKDIARAVKGCSEKTIQRELNALITQGAIVREGEKRWSVYKKTH